MSCFKSHSTDELAWAGAYVGLPFAERGRSREGLDCWGLIQLAYAEELGIELPSYAEDYASLAERREIAAIAAGAEATDWRRVSIGGFVGDIWPLDVVMFKDGALGRHVGLVMRPGLMLHVARRDCAKVEDYATARWKELLLGVYRHRERRAP